MSIESLLHAEIRDELEHLKEVEAGTEQYRTSVDGVTKLLDRAIEIDKFNAEVKEKEENRDFDTQLRLTQAKDEKRDRIVKNAIAIGGILIPTIVTIWGTLASFKFEEEGSISTIMGRGFINKLLPKK